MRKSPSPNASDSPPFAGELVVVSRACFVADGERRCFQNADGLYLDSIGQHFERVVLLAPVYRRGVDPQYDSLRNYTHVFQHPRLEAIEMPEARGARQLARLLVVCSQQARLLQRVLTDHPHALVYLFFPTYRAALAAGWCVWQRRRFVVYSGAMWSETVRLSPRWGGRPPWYLGLYVGLMDRLQRFAFQRASARLFTAPALLQEFGHLPRTYRAQPFLRLPLPRQFHPRALHRPVRLLAVGAVVPGKGHDLLYRALRELANLGVEARLDLAGAADANWKMTLDRLAAELGLADWIHYHGWIAEPVRLAELYDQADLFVLPTRSEGFPRVLYEACGHGLPVICTDLANIARFVQHGEQALLVPPENPTALAQAIAQTVRDDALRNRLGAGGWRWAQAMCSETAVEQFQALLRQLIQETHR
jgi:glycosyltransferase involved in cell wall biosynthesis